MADTDSSIARVREYYERVDAGDVEGVVNMFAPDAEYQRPGYDPFIGHAALERFYGGQRVIKQGRHTVTSVIGNGGDVAVQGSFAGVLHDGSEVSLRFADFFRVTDGGAFARRDTYFFAPMV
ncbi:nuclear transport factor 2 family protein [Skermania sp. ID1734]|uniref:nuclear transport factor 2 family protein n=1 Tax=Skermania sp. ID1734 TaxID=2597516 RepID=UPI00117E977A|nr:nuclear transport factor 2 family protein [Skermania sp. ID1734]TSD97284.1 nuclear transport factor 2 family protein [Skermania sp. ID1734]